MLLFGAKSKAKVVAGGRVEERHCNECERVTTFRECNLTDRFSLFFVELGESTQRRLVCTECGEDLPLETGPAHHAPPARPTRAAPSAPPKRSISEREKEQLLAELKKKMNRR